MYALRDAYSGRTPTKPLKNAMDIFWVILKLVLDLKTCRNSSCHNGRLKFGSLVILQWWLEIYPTLREEDKPLECTQLPGETIMVPSGWWHCVLNIGDSIAVTQNYVNSVNLELVCLDMAPGYHHRGIARAGRLALEEILQRTSKGVRDCQGINGATHK